MNYRFEKPSVRGNQFLPFAVVILSIVGTISHLSTEVVTARAAGQRDAPAPAQGQDSEQMEHGVPMTGSHLPFHQHPAAAPEVVARGKAVFGVQCAFCHGADAAGGAVGPNLLRSQIVIDDNNGELLAPIIHGSRADRGMPAVQVSQQEIAEIAAFLHSFRTGENERPAKPIDIVVGNAERGKTVFHQLCASCHSVTGDLAGIASKVPNARNLQQTWLLPSGSGRGGRAPRQNAVQTLHVQPVTVTVTLASGQSITGVLERIDDFYVGLTTSTGDFRSFTRNGDQPKVELHDPLAPHRALIPKYSDQQIHDITAYLRTIK